MERGTAFRPPLSFYEEVTLADVLATTDELAERLPFVMDPDELREAEGALIDLSDEARHHGSDRWISEDTTPESVINLILRAATRHMKNYEGYTNSRAGDESVSWSDKGVNSGSAHFTPDEQARLGELGGYRRTGFYTVNMYAYNSGRGPYAMDGYVPDEGSREPIAFFAHATEPW